MELYTTTTLGVRLDPLLAAVGTMLAARSSAEHVCTCHACPLTLCMISCRQPSPPSHLLSFIQAQAQAHPATPSQNRFYQRSRVGFPRTRAHSPRNHSHLLPTMENTAVSEAALRASIVERLNAVHVDITDMSGSFLPQHDMPHHPTHLHSYSHSFRRMWSGLLNLDCVAQLRRVELTQETPPRSVAVWPCPETPRVR